MRGPSPWTPERDDALRGLWDAGHSGTAIADKLGITKNAVIGRVHRLKLPARQSPINVAQAQPWSEDDDGLLRAIYGGGLTVAQIAERMGRSPHAISYRAANLGLKAGKRDTQTRPRHTFARLPAGRGVPSRQTWPATTSRPRAGEPGAAVATAHCPSSLNSPEVARLTDPPPRVFSGTECKFPLWGHEKPDEYRFCAEPVRDNAKGCASPYCAAHYAACYTITNREAGNPPPLRWRV